MTLSKYEEYNYFSMLLQMNADGNMVADALELEGTVARNLRLIETELSAGWKRLGDRYTK